MNGNENNRFERVLLGVVILVFFADFVLTGIIRDIKEKDSKKINDDNPSVQK